MKAQDLLGHGGPNTVSALRKGSVYQFEGSSCLSEAEFLPSACCWLSDARCIDCRKQEVSIILTYLLNKLIFGIALLRAWRVYV